MAACSKNQLVLEPATGTGVTNGVIQVTVPTSITTASNEEDIMKEANTIVVAVGDAYDYTFVMYVISDTPLSWGSTAGVAYTPGEISWYKDDNAVDTVVR